MNNIIQHIAIGHAELIIGNKLLLEISEVRLHHNTRQGGNTFIKILRMPVSVKGVVLSIKDIYIIIIII